MNSKKNLWGLFTLIMFAIMSVGFVSMYEHDIDDNLNIIEGKTETFKYKTENGHLYTQKQKEGKEYSWKDEGEYTITNNVLEVTKDSGKANRYLKIK